MSNVKNPINSNTQEISVQNIAQNIINAINNEPKNPYEFVAVIDVETLTLTRIRSDKDGK